MACGHAWFEICLPPKPAHHVLRRTGHDEADISHPRRDLRRHGHKRATVSWRCLGRTDDLC
jgi:hypothetical protein